MQPGLEQARNKPVPANEVIEAEHTHQRWKRKGKIGDRAKQAEGVADEEKGKLKEKVEDIKHAFRREK